MQRTLQKGNLETKGAPKLVFYVFGVMMGGGDMNDNNNNNILITLSMKRMRKFFCLTNKNIKSDTI